MEGRLGQATSEQDSLCIGTTRHWQGQKPCLEKDDGRLDIQALRGEYENAAMHEQYINKAKRTLETLTYRN